MASDPIAARYAQALFETARGDGAIQETLEQVAWLGALLRDTPEFRQLMFNPDVDPEDKVGVCDRLFAGSWSPLVKAFARMVVSLGRAEFLSQIADAFQALVDEEQGRMRVVVRSARALPEQALTELRARLEQRERKRIELTTEVEPALLGGIQVRLDHRVIDGSVRRQLDDLRNRLKAVSIH